MDVLRRRNTDLSLFSPSFIRPSTIYVKLKPPGHKAQQVGASQFSNNNVSLGLHNLVPELKSRSDKP